MVLSVVHIPSNRHKKVFSQSSKVKRKPVPPPRRRFSEEEDKVSDSDDDGLEMKNLVATVEEDDGNYYHSNIGTCYHLCTMYIVTAETGISDIPEDDFPDHVKEMHQDRDQKFEVEYKVSTSY